MQILKGLTKTGLKKIGLLNTARRMKDRTREAAFFFKNFRTYHHGSSDGHPLPPARLLTLVAGTPDISWFLQSGKLAAQSIEEALLKNGFKLGSFRQILDFGCGCGRVLRHFSNHDGVLYGTDMNPQLVQWCKDHLHFARFSVNSLAPPVSFEDNAIDLVYALSVFTHMSEELETSWMKELSRLLKTSGILILSLHGESYLHQLSPAERTMFQKGHRVVRDTGAVGSNRFGAFHPYSYVERLMVRDFKIVDFLPRGAAGNPQQDLYLFQKV